MVSSRCVDSGSGGMGRLRRTDDDALVRRPCGARPAARESTWSLGRGRPVKQSAEPAPAPSAKHTQRNSASAEQLSFRETSMSSDAGRIPSRGLSHSLTCTHCIAGRLRLGSLTRPRVPGLECGVHRYGLTCMLPSCHFPPRSSFLISCSQATYSGPTCGERWQMRTGAAAP